MHADHCGITQNVYLPTMPEDVLPHIQAALQSHEDVEGKFYGTFIFNINKLFMFSTQNAQMDINTLWEM